MPAIFLESLRNRVRAMNTLYVRAISDMTLDQVNHHERPGVLPIAFSLSHFIRAQDQSISPIFLSEPTLWENGGWAQKVGVTVDRMGRTHRSVSWMWRWAEWLKRSLFQPLWLSLRTKPELRWLAAIVVLAAALRIVWVLYAAREPQGLYDPTQYLLYAEQIANGNGYRDFLDGSPTAHRPIGYPAALGAVFALVKYTPIPDNRVLAGTFLNVFLGVATVGLAYHLGHRLFSRSIGLLSALWLAVFPSLIFYTAVLFTETIFIFLVMAGLAVLLSADWQDRRVGRGRLLLFAVLLGFSVLVRPISLVFLPLLPIVWLLTGFGWRRSLAYTGAVLVVTAAVIAPWSIRNAVVMGAPIITSTNLGDNLCIGHFPGATGRFDSPDVCFPQRPEDLERGEFAVRRSRDNIGKAVRYALSHPRVEVKLLARKAWYLWRHDHDGLFSVESFGDDPFIDPGLRTALSRTADTFYLTTISLGGLGLLAFVTRPLEPRRLFFLLALLGLAGVPLVFFGVPRFHLPVLPLLVVSAAWTVVALRGLPQLLHPATRHSP